MAGDGDKTYSVGYRHPPQHTTLIDEALDERVTIKENGKTRKVTKRVAMAKQVVNKAAVGNLKAVLFLMLQLKERDKVLLSSSEKDIAVRSTWDFDVNEERELTQWQSTIQTLLQRGMNPKELGITAEMLNSPEKEVGSSIPAKANESTAIDRSKKVK